MPIFGLVNNIEILLSKAGLGPQNDGTLDPVAKTPHDVLLDLDEYMVKYKRFQTRDDWQIELDTIRARRWAILSGVIPFWAMSCMTATDATLESYMSRAFSPFRLIYASAYKMQRPLQMRQGFGRRCAVALPVLMWISTSLAAIESHRAKRYTGNNTVFGEVARNLAAGNVADPFVTVPKRLASKPAEEFTAGDKALAQVFMPVGWKPGQALQLPVSDTLFANLQKIDLPAYW